MAKYIGKCLRYHTWLKYIFLLLHFTLRTFQGTPHTWQLLQLQMLKGNGKGKGRRNGKGRGNVNESGKENENERGRESPQSLLNFISDQVRAHGYTWITCLVHCNWSFYADTVSKYQFAGIYSLLLLCTSGRFLLSSTPGHNCNFCDYQASWTFSQSNVAPKEEWIAVVTGTACTSFRAL